MKILSHTLIAASLLCMMGCSKGDNKNTVETGANNAAATSTNTAGPANNAGQVQLETLPQASAPAATPATTIPLNPAHGEPGHRCDIPVGVPLNSAPAGAAPASASPAASSPGNTTPQQTHINAVPRFNPSAGQSGAVAAGTNPPHGQPGHDCSIPVGAPLKR